MDLHFDDGSRFPGGFWYIWWPWCGSLADLCTVHISLLIAFVYYSGLLFGVVYTRHLPQAQASLGPGSQDTIVPEGLGIHVRSRLLETEMRVIHLEY